MEAALEIQWSGQGSPRQEILSKWTPIGHKEQKYFQRGVKNWNRLSKGVVSFPPWKHPNPNEEGLDQLQLLLKQALLLSGLETRQHSEVFSNLNYARNYKGIHFLTYPYSNYNAVILQPFLCSIDQLNKESHSYSLALRFNSHPYMNSSLVPTQKLVLPGGKLGRETGPS